MNTHPTEQDIIGLEQKYWNAMKNHNVEMAVELTRFPCIIASPKGAQRVEEKEYRKMMKSSNEESFQRIEIENPEVNFLNADTALISYSTKHNGMNMLDVSTWVREDGKWACAFHSENPVH